MMAGVIRRPPLARIITQRLALTSLVAIVLQVCVVGVQYYSDQDQFTLDFVSREASILARGLSQGPDGLRFALPRDAAHFAGPKPAGYAFKVVTSEGVLTASPPEFGPTWSSPSSAAHLELWFHRLEGPEWLSFVGGQRFKVGGRDAWVEVATQGDPLNRHWWVLGQELAKLVWLPMLPLVVLLLGVATFSITRSLRPLAKAAQQAEEMSLLETSARFDPSVMPREAASFALSINRLLDRGRELINGQKMFIAKAAHELRTPLAVMTLELGKIPDPRARRLEADVAAMTEMVNRLLTLARLGTLKHQDFSQFDLRSVVEETVARIKPLLEQMQHKVLTNLGPSQRLEGDKSAVHEAVRNLIENAVKHTPAGSTVFVTVGENGSVTVEDDGKGFGDGDIPQLTEPFAKGASSAEGAGLGLAIVRQAVDLHRGALEFGRSARGGALVRVRFSAAR